jgi:hypothetical protein
LSKALKENPNLQIKPNLWNDASQFWNFAFKKKDFTDFITKFTKCGVFHCVYDNKEIDGKGPQVMCCMFCYKNSIDASHLAITQARNFFKNKINNNIIYIL